MGWYNATNYPPAQLRNSRLFILYVALTRACQTLILAGTSSRNRVEERWPALAPLTTRKILQANNYLDWFGAGLPAVTGTTTWFRQSSGEVPLLHWTVYRDQDSRLAEDVGEVSGSAPAAGVLASLDESALRALRERLSWQYPFAAATTEPAKMSVSALRRRVLEDTDEEAQPLPFLRENARSFRIDEARLTAVEAGIAHHLFPQFAMLDQVGSIESLQREARRLEGEAVLTSAERAALDLTRIAAFWQTEVGCQILSHKAAVHREVPFTARLTLSEVPQVLSGSADFSAKKFSDRARLADEYIVVQGVVDLLVLLPEELWLLDFKTDSVRERDWKEKARSYAPQVRLYSFALGRIYRRPVKNCWLHFLALSKTVECPEI